MLQAQTVVRLPTVEEYFNRFFEIYADKGDCSYKEAWEALEEEYFAVFERYRYSSYESFKANKWKYIKGLLNRK